MGRSFQNQYMNIHVKLIKSLCVLELRVSKFQWNLIKKQLNFDLISHRTTHLYLKTNCEGKFRDKNVPCDYMIFHVFCSYVNIFKNL